MSLNKLTKNTARKVGAALMHAAFLAGALSSGTANAGYYAGRKGSYSRRNQSYLLDEGLKGISYDWLNHKKPVTIKNEQKSENLPEGLQLKQLSTTRELLIVDRNIKDYDQLSRLAQPGLEVIEIPGDTNGLEFLVRTLNQYENLGAVHLFSHASAGQLQLGNSLVDTRALQSQPEIFTALNKAIAKDGDLLLYGCELAKEQEGDDFLEIIKGNTHIDVAASDDKSGNEAFDSDWDLEIHKGNIEAKPLANSIALRDFTEVLQFTGTIKFDQVKTSGNYYGGASVDAEFYTSPSKEYILIADGQDYGTGSFYAPSALENGVLTYNGETKVRLKFSQNEFFDVDGSSSIYITNYSGGTRTFSFSSDNGSMGTQTINSYSGAYINLNINNTNITYVDITASDEIYAHISLFKVVNVHSAPTNNSPEIAETTSGQSVSDNSTINPFSAVTIIDADGDNVSATITLDNDSKGVLSGVGLIGTGPYTISSNSAANLQSIIRALTFDPADNRTGSSETTTFTIEVSDGMDTDTDVNTTVISNAVAPNVTSVDVPADNTYIIGNNLDFSINFNENISVNTGGGIPQMAILIGSATRQAAFLGGSGTKTLTFRYTIVNGDEDLDGLGMGTLSNNGGSLQDVGGKDANLDLNSVGNTNNILVDGVPPSLNSADSNPNDDETNVSISNNIVIDFNEIIASGTGIITIKDITNGGDFELFDVANNSDGNTNAPGAGRISISGDKLYINPSTDFAQENQYAIQIDGTALDDLNSNNFPGISDNTTFNFTTIANSAPVFSNLDGSPTFNEGGSAVILDADVTVADTELDALNSANGNYSGASISISRNGGANANDQFTNSGLLGALTESGSLTYNGSTVGTVTTNSSGNLKLTFNTNATTAVVQSVLQSISYQNQSNDPATSIALDWVFSDGTASTSGTNQTVVSVTPVNDEPTFTIGANQTVISNAGAVTTNGFASGMDDGDSNTQTLTFNVSNDNNGLFSVQPAIDAITGDLSFTPESTAFGQALVTVNLSDDGGTADGGNNQSPNQTFTIYITPSDITINEIDPDATGSSGEFVEIYDGGTGNTDLTGLVLVWYNGDTDQIYKNIGITGSTDADGYYVLGETGVTNLDQDWGTTALQNGPDAVALYVGSTPDFTNGDASTTDGLVEAIVYGSTDDAALRAALGGVSLNNEDINGNAGSESLSRVPNGQGNLAAQGATPGNSNIPVVSLSQSVSSFDESAGTNTITATLSSTFSKDVVVTLGTSGTATSSSDYNLSSNTITINSGSSSGTALITGLDDTSIESDETVIVDVTGVTEALENGTQQVTSSITDDDTPKISVNDPTITEGNTGTVKLTYTVSLDQAAPSSVSVDYATSDGTASAGSDYTALGSTTLTFNTGETSKTVEVVVESDEIVEANETVILTLSNASGADNPVITDETGVGTIQNDDTAIVTIGDESGNENDGGITLTATLSQAVQGGFSVDISSADGTATTGDNDYTAISSQTLAFSGTVGETQTFSLVPTSDTKLEADETFTIQQSNLTVSLPVDITDEATVTLLNDDAAAVTIADVSGNEEGGSITISLLLDHAVQGGFTLDVNTADGTAIGGTDYASISNQTIIFAGTAEETQTFNITPVSDTDAEGDEDLTISMNNLGSTLLSVNITDEATITIQDDDTPQISIDDQIITEGDNGSSTLIFNVTLDQPAVSTITVDCATIDESANSGSDYIAQTSMLTFNSGESSKTIQIDISGDEMLEGDETFKLELSNPSGFVSIADAVGIGTITDDDAASVTIADANGLEDESGITVTAVLDYAVQGGFTIEVISLDGTATTADQDYISLSSHTLTFSGTAGETQTFIVVPETDSKLEGDETLKITQQNLSGTVLSIDITDEAIVTIENDDAAAVTFTDASGNEDDGGVIITATLNHGVQGGFTVDMSTADGTGLAGTDYEAVVNKTLTFVGEEGETQSLTVLPISDQLVEEDETIFISQSNLAGTGLTVDISDKGMLTITNDDHAPDIEPGQVFTVMEKASNGSVVGIVAAADSDNDALQNWTIIAGNSSIDGDSNGPFSINSSTGELTLIDTDDLNASHPEFNLTLTVSDGVNTSSPAEVTVQVEIINDAPTFTSGKDQSVLEDAGAHTVKNWATDISAGPTDESGQALQFYVSNGNQSLFVEQPEISPDGTLTFTPAADAFGTATIMVSLKDDGGTANGGSDTSQEETFTINILPVNDAPAFVAGNDQTVTAGAASYQMDGWATAISTGAENESIQTYSFQLANDQSSFFTDQPAVNNQGDLTFTIADGVSGTAHVTVKLVDDGGTDHGGVNTSEEFEFSITIGKLPQEIVFNEIEDKKAGQDPIVLEATGGNSGNPVIYTLITQPATGVAHLEGNILYLDNVGSVVIIASQEGNASYEAAEDVQVTFNISGNELFLPTLFSPNGDGTNDQFILRGAGGVAAIELCVYNRDGQVVYRSDDFVSITQKGWDGAHQGKALPPGNYVWVLKGSYQNGQPLLVNGRNTGTIRLTH